MNRQKFALLCISAVTAATLMTACNPSADTSGGTTASESASAPTQGSSNGNSSTPDPLFDEVAPCDLLSDADMNKLFKTTTFSHEGGGVVEDFHGRHCLFTGSDAYIDDDNRYSLADVSIDVLVQIDDQNGTLWAAYKSVEGNFDAIIPGTDDAIKIGGAGDGWLQAQRGRVVITVQDHNQEIKDGDAIRIIQTAFNNLSAHHG